MSGIPTTDDVRLLLERLEDSVLNGPEANAYNYLAEVVDDKLWGPHDSHSGLRLYHMCYDLLERVLLKP